MKEKSKSLVKNTLILYLRMLFIMFVMLYASRVVLDGLGAEDYGLYQTVGSIVALLSFFTNALTSASSRFITYELGRGNFERIQIVFSTLFLIHIIFAFIIIIFGEVLGLWFIYNKLVLPACKFNSAVLIFHVSLITAAMAIMQVPYMAVIIAHENLSVYAYITIVEALLKLGVAFCIQFSSYDRLKLYAVLYSISQIFVMMLYRVYCLHVYNESKFHFKKFDKLVLKNVGAFSAWSLFSATAIAFANQGIIILLNNFFSSVVVTAKTLSDQVNSAANQLAYNFRTAVNPRIIKLYATEKYKDSESLLLMSTRFSYYLLLLLALPVFFLSEPLLNLWLKEVPPYTIFFLRISMVQSLFSVFDSSLFIALYAKGQLKENALISPIIFFLKLPFVYFLLFLGYSPLSAGYVALVADFILGCVVKPILVCKIVGYNYMEIIKLFLRCLFVTLLSLPLPIMIIINYSVNTFSIFLIVCCSCVFSIFFAVYFFGITSDEKNKLKEYMSVIKKGFYEK